MNRLTGDAKDRRHGDPATVEFDSIEGTHGAHVVRGVPLLVNCVLHDGDYDDGRSPSNETAVHLASLVKSRRLERGLSQDELARRIGISKAAVSSIEIGRTRSLRGPTMAGLMRELGISPEELTGKRPLQRRTQAYTSLSKGGPFEPPPATRIKVVGEARAADSGQWLRPELQDLTGTVDFHSEDPRAYSLKITGDSLGPRIRSGEFIVCEPGHECAAGDEVLITLINGRAMIRELVFQRDGQTTVNELSDPAKRTTLRDAEIESIDFIAAIVKASRYQPD